LYPKRAGHSAELMMLVSGARISRKSSDCSCAKRLRLADVQRWVYWFGAITRDSLRFRDGVDSPGHLHASPRRISRELRDQSRGALAISLFERFADGGGNNPSHGPHGHRNGNVMLSEPWFESSWRNPHVFQAPSSGAAHLPTADAHMNSIDAGHVGDGTTRPASMSARSDS